MDFIRRRVPARGFGSSSTRATLHRRGSRGEQPIREQIDERLLVGPWEEERYEVFRRVLALRSLLDDKFQMVALSFFIVSAPLDGERTKLAPPGGSSSTSPCYMCILSYLCCGAPGQVISALNLRLALPNGSSDLCSIQVVIIHMT